MDRFVPIWRNFDTLAHGRIAPVQQRWPACRGDARWLCIHPDIHYWNNGQKEVDYLLRDGPTIQALEVKSGHNMGNVSGLTVFVQLFEKAQPLLIVTVGMPLDLWLQS